MRTSFLALIILCVSIAALCATGAKLPSIIPAPARLETRDGVFALSRTTLIKTDSASRKTGTLLAECLRKPSGFPIKLESLSANESAPRGKILLTTAEASANLGAQGNLWTEYVADFRHAEYMLFPRACALAEVVWSPKDARNWQDFSRRLEVHHARLEALGVNYRHTAINEQDGALSR